MLVLVEAAVGTEGGEAPKVNLSGDVDDEDDDEGVGLLLLVLVAVVSVLLSAVVGRACLRWALDGSILLVPVRLFSVVEGESVRWCACRM